MNIVGLDSLLFGVEDVDACARYLDDYGLLQVELSAGGGRYEAQDGSAIVFRKSTDCALPPTSLPSPNIRETVYGVADEASLMRIADELSRDREVRLLDDGSIHSVDDSGFAIAFQLTVRRKLALPPELVNAPGAPIQRAINQPGVDLGARVVPRSLSHVVYFVPNVSKAEKFYAERLGFRTTDRFIGVGPFMRPAGTLEHHTLFLLQSFNPHMVGLNHFTFHLAGPNELLQAGTRFTNKGYKGFWGPGRHVFGSNYFWYFNSPFGGLMEYDADMDLHDDSWIARSAVSSADTSQAYLFSQREPWAPGA